MSKLIATFKLDATKMCDTCRYYVDRSMDNLISGAMGYCGHHDHKLAVSIYNPSKAQCGKHEKPNRFGW